MKSKESKIQNPKSKIGCHGSLVIAPRGRAATAWLRWAVLGIGLLTAVCGCPQRLPSEFNGALPDVIQADTRGLILFTSNRDFNLELYVMKSDGTDQKRFTAIISNEPYADWSPDGHRIVFATDLDFNHNLYVVNTDGLSKGERILDLPGNESRPRWSPDGSRIAFQTDTDDPNSLEIYTVKPDGTDLRRLTNDTFLDSAPCWSPDGTQIAFSSNREGGPFDLDIYTMNADGTNIRRVTDSPEGQGSFYPDWSPDGNQIAFMRQLDNGDKNIFVINVDGTNEHALTTDGLGNSEPAWSPDGSQLAFGALRRGATDIFRMNADGTTVVQLTSSREADSSPRWSPVQ